MKFKLRKIKTRRANTPEAYLEAAARAAGCATEEEVSEFLAAVPPIHNTIAELPDYAKARDRIREAIGSNERIVIYADCDCDGITALVQLFDTLRAAGHDNVAWFVPDRITDDYGLTMSGLKRCVGLHSPRLVIGADCGSNSADEIGWLRNMGIDCIVVDHHEIASASSLPAVACLNPGIFGEGGPSVKKMADMSASGLAFLFCEQFAADAPLPAWDRNRSLLLAGLGTLADVVPLVGINRALVKHSLRLANDPDELRRVPGLAALKAVSGTGDVKSHTYGFEWGPRINAMGRLEDAATSVRLLLSKTPEEAGPLAAECNRTNAERQDIQRKIVEEARAEALPLVAQGCRVIVLARKEWHVGIVGIVASKIKEMFNRPAIVCGWREEGNCWRGSGRSVEGFDMGGAAESAVENGILLRGGGHKMACGLSFSDGKLADLRKWMDSKCPLTERDFVPTHPVLGRSFAQSPQTWVDIYEKLEPFGSGNPRPLLRADGRLVWIGEKKNKEDSTWGVRGGFICDGGPGGLVYFTWTDVARASAEWKKGSKYRIFLSVRKSVRDCPGGGRQTYYDWYVEDCELIPPFEPTFRGTDRKVAF